MTSTTRVASTGVTAVVLMLACAAIAQPVSTPGTSPPSASTLAYPPAPAATPPVAPARGPVPGKSETAMEAYGKLNRTHAGYLTWDDVRQLDGFDTAFQQADQNRDGRLNPAEFNSAWAMYTGNTP